MLKERIMRRSTGWLAVLVMVGLLAVAPALAQETGQSEEAPLDAQAILDRVNAAWQGDSFHGIVRLDITIAGALKSHALEIWTLGEELALVRVLEPEIDLNSGYLQLGDELWYYSPIVGSIKLPSMAIGDALFGTGPSLSDVSHGTLSDDYDASVEEIDDDPDDESDARWFLTLIPHADAPVVFGQLEILVTADFVMETMIYFDQRGEILQTAVFSDVIELGEQKFATTIVIEDSFGDRTIQQIENPQFDLEIDASFFSIETFEGWGESE